MMWVGRFTRFSRVINRFRTCRFHRGGFIHNEQKVLLLNSFIIIRNIGIKVINTAATRIWTGRRPINWESTVFLLNYHRSSLLYLMPCFNISSQRYKYFKFLLILFLYIRNKSIVLLLMYKLKTSDPRNVMTIQKNNSNTLSFHLHTHIFMIHTTPKLLT